MKKQKFKLTIELVPSTVWFSSVYQIYKGKNQLNKWRRIKKELFKREGGKCWICGAKSTHLEAHEFWEYDDKNHVQKLIGIHHLCDMCHKVKHIGFWCHTKEGSRKLEEEGLSKEDLINHFCKVNNCSRKKFEKHEKEALNIWEERSKYEWKQDFADYDPYKLMKWDKITSYSDGFWEWFHSLKTNGPICSGKYLFFSKDRDSLIKLLIEIFKKSKLAEAKIPLNGNQVGGEYVLCVYSESDKDMDKFKRLTNKYSNIKFRGWKSDEDTLKGKYSKIFEELSLKESEPRVIEKFSPIFGKNKFSKKEIEKLSNLYLHDKEKIILQEYIAKHGEKFSKKFFDLLILKQYGFSLRHILLFYDLGIYKKEDVLKKDISYFIKNIKNGISQIVFKQAYVNLIRLTKKFGKILILEDMPELAHTKRIYLDSEYYASSNKIYEALYGFIVDDKYLCFTPNQQDELMNFLSDYIDNGFIIFYYGGADKTLILKYLRKLKIKKVQEKFVNIEYLLKSNVVLDMHTKDLDSLYRYFKKLNKNKNVLPTIDKFKKLNLVSKILDNKDKKLMKELKRMNKLDILKLKYVTENLQKFS